MSDTMKERAVNYLSKLDTVGLCDSGIMAAFGQAERERALVEAAKLCMSSQDATAILAVAKPEPVWCADDCPWPWKWDGKRWLSSTSDGHNNVCARDVEKFCSYCGKARPQ